MNLINMGGWHVDLDSSVSHKHNEKVLLHRVWAQLKHNEQILNKIMVTQEVLNASAARLEASAKAIIALIGNSGATTPDAVVVDFQSKVDAQSSALEAAASGTTTGGT